jgi:hypothetical protein
MADHTYALSLYNIIVDLLVHLIKHNVLSSVRCNMVTQFYLC